MKTADIKELIVDGLSLIKLDVTTDSVIYQAAAVLLLVVFAFLAFVIARTLRHLYTKNFTITRKSEWDDELQKHGFFRRCGHVLPALVIFISCPLLFEESDLVYGVLRKIMQIYIVVAVVWAGSALFNTIEDIYNSSELAKRAPITGFVQVGKLLMVIIAALLIISSLLSKSPLILLSGLGAIAAVLLLLFRDTILGFVAGIQIAANRMVTTGDWVELPKYGADGEVLQVGLTTVKVRNWDKTISTVPTYSLITDSMKNWRGMTESDGRRIKRHLQIDIQSVRFCDAAMVDEYKKIRYIKDYIEKKTQELRDFHQLQNIDEQDLINSRRLTNIGTLRAYMKAYLTHHPKINQDMTLMVRQLPPTEHGLPIEIYCFSADKDWVAYEGIQADIFDHLIAMLPIFNLRAYQKISDNPAVLNRS